MNLFTYFRAVLSFMLCAWMLHFGCGYVAIFFSCLCLFFQKRLPAMGAQAVGHLGAAAVACGLSSCSSLAQSTGSIVVGRNNVYVAVGSSPRSEIRPMALQWQVADSYHWATRKLSWTLSKEKEALKIPKVDELFLEYCYLNMHKHKSRNNLVLQNGGL